MGSQVLSGSPKELDLGSLVVSLGDSVGDPLQEPAPVPGAF